MRLVIFADLHLDTPFAWADTRVARQRRQSLRDTLRRILTLADEVAADAVCCAGDLYEHERVSADTAAFVRASLADAGRPVFLAPGNHDWLAPAGPYRQVDWPPNVHVFTSDRLAPVELTAGLTLWGAAHLVPAGTKGFFDHGFHVDRGGIHLALVHASERSGLVDERTGKSPHAPFDVEQIPAAGLHHAFCGHYHRPRDGDWHTYPGNPDPLTFGEDGLRGAVVADIAGDGSVERRRVAVAQTTVHDVDVDVTGCRSREDVRAAVAAALTGRRGVARVTVEGDLAAQVDLALPGDLTLEGLPGDGLGDLEVVLPRRGTLRVTHDVDGLATEPTVRGQFVRDTLAADLDPGERSRVLTTGLRALAGRDDLEVL